MREIKFRAWDNETHEMRDWDTLYHHSFRSMFKDYDWELMQYTGLKDKNGKEIYEGDILCWNNKIARPEYLDSLWQVVWDNACFAIRYIGGGKHSDTATFKYHWKDYMEVIGNIYENPELLKE